MHHWQAFALSIGCMQFYIVVHDWFVAAVFAVFAILCISCRFAESYLFIQQTTSLMAANMLELSYNTVNTYKQTTQNKISL
jgi:hypothetical protein